MSDQQPQAGFSINRWWRYLKFNIGTGASVPTASAGNRGMLTVQRGSPDLLMLSRQDSTGTAFEFVSAVTSRDGFTKLGGTGTPTITAGSSAGTGASIANAAGPDFNGYFELTAGTTPATGQVAQVQFAFPPPTNNYAVFFSDESGTLYPKSPYIRNKTTVGFFLGMNVAPTTGQVYKVSYVVIGQTP